MRYKTDGHASSETCPFNKRTVLITSMRYDNGWPHRLPCLNWISSNYLLSSIILNKCGRIINMKINRTHILVSLLSIYFDCHKITLIFTTVKLFCCASVGLLIGVLSIIAINQLEYNVLSHFSAKFDFKLCIYSSQNLCVNCLSSVKKSLTVRNETDTLVLTNRKRVNVIDPTHYLL